MRRNQDVGGSRAAVLIDEGLALAHDAGDPKAIAQALTEAGRVAIVQGDLDRAKDLVTDAYARWPQLAKPIWVGSAGYLLGWIAGLQGDPRQAEVHFAEFLDEARALGSIPSIAGALESLGTSAREQGDHEGQT